MLPHLDRRAVLLCLAVRVAEVVQRRQVLRAARAGRGDRTLPAAADRAEQMETERLEQPTLSDAGTVAEAAGRTPELLVGPEERREVEEELVVRQGMPLERLAELVKSVSIHGEES